MREDKELERLTKGDVTGTFNGTLNQRYDSESFNDFTLDDAPGKKLEQDLRQQMLLLQLPPYTKGPLGGHFNVA